MSIPSHYLSLKAGNFDVSSVTDFKVGKNKQELTITLQSLYKTGSNFKIDINAIAGKTDLLESITAYQLPTLLTEKVGPWDPPVTFYSVKVNDHIRFTWVDGDAHDLIIVEASGDPGVSDAPLSVSDLLRLRF